MVVVVAVVVFIVVLVMPVIASVKRLNCFSVQNAGKYKNRKWNLQNEIFGLAPVWECFYE